MKVQNLLFIKYSNYSNRLIKPIGTYMTDYYTQGDDVLEVAKVSFHQGNGIYAEQIVTTDFASFVYNYLLTSDNDDATLKVTTRWFVIGKEDLRNGQVRVSLKRDLISDYFNDVVDADFMMERGNLDFGAVGSTSATRTPDPLIFLPEGQEYNQIKTGSVKLYRFNNNEPSWLVGYVAKNVAGYQTVEIDADSSDGTIWGLDFSDANIQRNADDAFDIIAMPYKDVYFEYTSGGTTYQRLNKADMSLKIMTAFAAKGLLYDLQLVPYITGIGNDITIDGDGDVICSSSNIATANTGLDVNHISLMQYGIYKGQYPGNVKCTHSASSIIAYIPSDWPSSGSVLEVVFVSEKSAETVSDWNIWTGNTTYSLTNNRYVFTSGTDYNFDPGTGEITFVNPNLKNDLFTMMDNGLAHLEISYKYGNNPGSVYPIIMSLAHSHETFSFARNISASLGGGSVPINDLKLSKETQVYRLVSPNHASIFEWSPAMNYIFYNNGGTTVFEANCFSYQVALDLKPFDPYIRVQPQFRGTTYGTIYKQGLYGTNFYDGRGLICDGDFSLTMPTNAWENYKLNNKTFASAFSREISTLEKKYEYGIANDVLAGVGSTFGGAVAGGLKGGIPGAIAGAAVGLGTGIYKGIENSVMRRESINKTKAEFRMNLQSIQARPDAIHKVGPFDPDNDIWPTVELYMASGVEQTQFIKKMQMTGMVAHKETTIADQMTDVTIIYPRTFDSATYQFFSGSIIQMPADTEATPEMINEINNELQSGVYFATSLF